MIENKIYVPKRFSDMIALHIAKNLLPYESPLILGVQGRPGEGKTRQCHAVLERLGVTVVSLSGREFGSRHEGVPAEVLIERYQHASTLVELGKARRAALLVNDFDAVVGNFGDLVQYTVNTQLINAVLMGMCDFPLRVGDTSTVRIPLIVTANDLSKLYGPLTRPGRMTVFTWEPSFLEKVEVVATLYSDLDVSTTEVRRLVSRYRNRPIAFFAVVRNRLVERHLLKLFESQGDVEVLNALQSSIQQVIHVSTSVEELNLIAREIAQSHQLRNFLSENKE